jgi:hypothetical protein
LVIKTLDSELDPDPQLGKMPDPVRNKSMGIHNPACVVWKKICTWAGSFGNFRRYCRANSDWAIKVQYRFHNFGLATGLCQEIDLTIFLLQRHQSTAARDEFTSFSFVSQVLQFNLAHDLKQRLR